jgi:hypothetical protein
VLLRQGDIAGARNAARSMKNDQTWFAGLLQTCLQPGSAVDIERLQAEAREAQRSLLELRDPEQQYFQAAVLTFCGQREIATKLLFNAISLNYCATEALEDDPLLAKLRPYPEFATIRNASLQCQKKFLAGRGQRVQ